ncbi:uncharacterized protein LOC126687878 [Mercurialis annua]|uniref:uncharacterized protein LOC126687878 n=1 Tax=Mercurialis annua TaxID=3986 RepID=UPI00215F4A8E|nr:uncharacterized protein LOC126687878 [Mercurialis annua]
MSLITNSGNNTLKALIYYNGKWDANFNYSDYIMKGIIIPDDTNFENLRSMIANILQVNYWETNMEIKYQLENNGQTLKVEDDNSLIFYLEMRKSDSMITKFPLCISTKKSEEQPQLSMINSNSSTTVNEEQTENVVSKDSPMDFVEYADFFRKQISIEVEEAESKLEDYRIITDPNQKEVYVGQIFKDKTIMKTCLSLYAIANNFQFKVIKSCTIEYVLNCLDRNCKWSLRASRDGRTSMFLIRRLNNIHTCSVDIRMEEKRQATSSIVAEVIKSKFLNVKTIYTPGDIISDFQKEYGVILNYNKAWRAKEKALGLIRGNPRDSYGVLPSYFHMILETNLGSVVDIQTAEDNRFLYAFMALDASIKGWKYCRPLVVTDGTFLKSNYGGTLLTACTQDGNGKIFPLAFAIVDSENDASWEYFFRKFKEAFGEKDGLCIVSDRCESISKAKNKLFPQASHGICMFHLLNNLKSKFKNKDNKVKECFYAAAKSYTVMKFDYHMKELDNINVQIRPYLMKIGKEKRARVYSKFPRYSTMTSNIAESMNAANKAARDLPVTTLLEYLRSLIQNWSYTNRTIAASTFTKLTNRAEEQLRENYSYSLRMKFTPSMTALYSVQDGTNTYIVKLKEKTCTCSRFQMDEMPCAHALTVLSSLYQDPYQYCSSFFSKENLVAVYEGVVYPMPSKNNWDISAEIEGMTVHPPIALVPAGRPRKQRIKSSAEGKQQNKCGRLIDIIHRVFIDCF